MDLNELIVAILKVCPDALFDEDPQTGEITVATGWHAPGDDTCPLFPVESEA